MRTGEVELPPETGEEETVVGDIVSSWWACRPHFKGKPKLRRRLYGGQYGGQRVTGLSSKEREAVGWARGASPFSLPKALRRVVRTGVNCEGLDLVMSYDQIIEGSNIQVSSCSPTGDAG